MRTVRMPAAVARGSLRTAAPERVRTAVCERLRNALPVLRSTLTALALAAVLAAPALGATAPKPRTSLTAIWNEVMCVSCHEPLAVAQSPQAIEERQYIQHLVGLGLTKAQIERQLVTQYGPAVLGRPPAHGFNLTVYILPPALLGAGALFLIFTLPRWRRRSRAAAAAPAVAGPPLDAEDARRLDEDLARFG